MNLHNVEEHLSTQPHQEITVICCTFCIHSPVPAVRSCLHCEASLCDDHLRTHSKSPEHVMTYPSTSLKNRKCSIHKEPLKYYCTEDAICICVSCNLAGVHRGHRVEMLDEASENKKKKLRNVLQKLITRKKQTEERVRSLEEHKRKVQEKTAAEVERVTALFIDMRRRLDDLEKMIVTEISKQVQVSSSDVIQRLLEIKKDELSRKMRHIEELCNMADPLTVLQEPDTGDLCDPEEGGGDEDTGGHDKTHDVDVDVISEIMHTCFFDIMTYLQNKSGTKPKRKERQPQYSPRQRKVLRLSNTEIGDNNVMVRTGNAKVEVTAAGQEGIYGQGPADILLDINTAGEFILITDDLKTATRAQIRQNYPETVNRFQYNQVMSRRGFTSGRHYWDVEISRSGWWIVGMCYPSIEKWGRQSLIGCNNKSWCLWYDNDNKYFVIHESKKRQLPHPISSNRFRICVDYGAGKLSFYELCDPIRHLYTFTTTFTEPLHAALYVYDAYTKILGGPAAGRH